MRRPFVCGNWKLNNSLSESQDLIAKLVESLAEVVSVEIAVAPVAPQLDRVGQLARASNIGVAAQNVFYEAKGAFTGEWSTSHLIEVGCRYAIIGHSERRALFAENDESVARKVQACVVAGIVPIACFGESLEQRENSTYYSVIEKQVTSILSLLSAEQSPNLVLAYEPIWAIGTGKSATAAQAQEIHSFVRSHVVGLVGDSAAARVRIIYGGSVNSENAAGLMKQQDIDGALVGGASLDANSFCAIIKSIA